ncbi:MAG: hypothetical protein VXW36_06415 [Candidatus Thermoplasmatota archaeon]|nr:hypothetical protein [Candidatus Thermoplasmatota archaeon]
MPPAVSGAPPSSGDGSTVASIAVSLTPSAAVGPPASDFLSLAAAVALAASK